MNRVTDIDFRDININEQLTILESRDFISATSLYDQMVAWENREVARIKTPWQKLDGVFEFATGGYHLVSGYSGHGKSTTCLQIAINACREHKVAIASLELPAGMVAQLIAQMGVATAAPSEEYKRKVFEYLEDRLFYFDKVDPIKPDEAIRLVIHAARDLGCKLVLLDCLFMIEGICQDPEKEQQFTQTLSAVAKKFDVAIILVHHVRKPSGYRGEGEPPGKEDLIGSSHMVNASWTTSVIWKNLEVVNARRNGEAVEEGECDVAFVVQKNRDMEYHGWVNLYEHRSRQLCESSKRKARPLV